MPFVKGESGNPAGRPPGARNKATLLCEALIAAEAETLTRQAIARAHDGDRAALRMCLDRVPGRGSDRPILFPLPRIESPEAAREAIGCITAASGTGELTPREATDLVRVVERAARALAAIEAAARARGDDSPEAFVAKLAEIFDASSAPHEDDKGAQDGSPARGVPAAGAPAVVHGAPESLAPRSGRNPGSDLLHRSVRNNENNGNNENTMKPGHPTVPPAAHANGRAPGAVPKGGPVLRQGQP
jgi:hypothetical protein